MSMDEVELIKKVGIWLFFIELGAILLIYFLNYNASIPALTQLNNISGSVSNKSTIMINSFNYTLIKQSSSPSGSGLFSINSVVSVLIIIVNFVAKILDFIINFVLLLGIGIYLVIYIIIFFIPSLFGSLSFGFLSDILNLGYGVILIIIAVYLFNRIRLIVRG